MIAYIISLTLLIAAVILVRLIFRKHVPARLVYALWLAMLIRMVLPVTLFTVNVHLPEVFSPAQNVQTAQDTGLTPSSPTVIPDDTLPGISIPADTGTVSPYTPVTPVQPAESGIETAAPPQSQVSEPVRTGKSEPFRPDWKQILNIIWAVGAGIMAVWFIVIGITFNAKLIKGRRFLRSYKGTKVYVSSGAGVPCVSWIVPSIYVTPEMSDPVSEEYIVRHEHTHIRHWDHIWSVVRAAVLTVFWWNPLVWAAAILSKQDSEFACDEAVSSGMDGSERLRYANTLLAAAPRRRTLATGLGSAPLKERILNLTSCNRNRLICLVLALVFTLAAAGCSFASVGNETDSGEDSGTEEQTPPENDLDRIELPASELKRINGLPGTEENALFCASTGDSVIFFFDDDMTYYVRRDMPSPEYYSGSLKLPEGYTDGKTVYMNQRDDAVTVVARTSRDGQTEYLKYVLKGMEVPAYAEILDESQIDSLRDEMNKSSPIRVDIYQLDDVYKTDDTPTYGTAEVWIPTALSGYSAYECEVVLCEEDKDPDGAALLLYYGYAPVWSLERIGEKTEEDGWNYHTYIYSAACPEALREAMREAGASEESLDPRRYLYLSEIDSYHYAFVVIAPEEGSGTATPDERALADGFVRDMKAELYGPTLISGSTQYVIEPPSEYYDYITAVGGYGKNIEYFYPDGNVIHAGVDGTMYYVMGFTNSENAHDGPKGFATYKVVSYNGYIDSVDMTETFTKHTVTSEGTPYTGKLGGIYRMYSYSSGQNCIIAHNIYILDDGTIYSLSGPYATDDGVTYKGTYEYDRKTGGFTATVTGSYYSEGVWYTTSEGTVKGKLLEYGGFVHFVCESSDLYSVTPDDPLPLTFVPNTDGYADPPVRTLYREFAGTWRVTGAEDIVVPFLDVEIDTDQSTISFSGSRIMTDSGTGAETWQGARSYSGTYSINPLTYTITADLTASDGKRYSMDLILGYSESADGRMLDLTVRSSDCHDFDGMLGKTISLVSAGSETLPPDTDDTRDSDGQNEPPEQWDVTSRETDSSLTITFVMGKDSDSMSTFVSNVGKGDMIDTWWTVETDPSPKVTLAFNSDNMAKTIRRRIFDKLSSLPVPSMTETDDIENSAEVRAAVSEVFTAVLNGDPVTGNMYRTQGNGHVDFVFSFDFGYRMVPGDELTLIWYTASKAETRDVPSAPELKPWNTGYSEADNGLSSNITAVFTVGEDMTGWTGFLGRDMTDITMDLIWSVDTYPDNRITLAFYPALFPEYRSPRGEAFESLCTLPTPSLTETSDTSNDPETRAMVMKVLNVSVNSAAVTGDLYRTQGNGHIDFVFSFDDGQEVAPGDVITVVVGNTVRSAGPFSQYFETIGDLFAYYGTEYLNTAYPQEDFEKAVDVFLHPENYRGEISDELYRALSGLGITEYRFFLDEGRKLFYITFTLTGTPIGALEKGENTCRIAQDMYYGVGVYCGDRDSNYSNQVRNAVSRYIDRSFAKGMPDVSGEHLQFTDYIVSLLRELGIEPTRDAVIKYAEECYGLKGYTPLDRQFDENGNHIQLGYGIEWEMKYTVLRDYEDDGTFHVVVRYYKDGFCQLSDVTIEYVLTKLENGAWKFVDAFEVTGY